MTSKDITEIIFTVMTVISVMTVAGVMILFTFRTAFEKSARALDQRIADAIRGGRNHD